MGGLDARGNYSQLVFGFVHQEQLYEMMTPSVMDSKIWNNAFRIISETVNVAFDDEKINRKM